MARSEARRQKQLAKKKAKRSARRGALKRLKSQSPAQRIAAARNSIRSCRLDRDSLTDVGIGNAALSVDLPSGDVGIVVFLIDRYCLGVKDVFGQILDPSEYIEWSDDFDSRTEVVSVTPETLRRLLDDAVTFAHSCGLSPHPDYHKWRAVLSDVDPDQAKETFEMGRDGKPLFMSGPHDSEARCRSVVAKLEEHCGAGNYHFMIGGAGFDPGEFDIEEFDGWEMIHEEEEWVEEEDDDECERRGIEFFDGPHG